MGQTWTGAGSPTDAVIIEIDTAANIIDTIEIQPNLGGDVISPRDFEIASDNSILLTGSAGSPDHQLLALRAGATGAIISDTTLGGDQNDYGNSVVEASSNGFAVAGWSASDIPTSSAYYVCRFSLSGALLWQKKYIKGATATGEALTTNDSDGFVIGGTASDVVGSANYIFLINVDADGDTIWTRQLGGTGNDFCEGLIKVSDGYIVTGWTGSLGAGEYDIYLGKVDFDGNILWEKGLGSTANESFQTISETADGGFILSALESGAVINNATAYIVKVNSLGNVVWELFYRDPLDVILGAFELDTNNIAIITQIDNMNSSNSSNMVKIKISGV